MVPGTSLGRPVWEFNCPTGDPRLSLLVSSALRQYRERNRVVVALSAGCPSNPSDPDSAWSVVFSGEDLHRNVLSVWGDSPDNIYLAGGGLGNGIGALALHYDGTIWRELDTGSEKSFWWVWSSGPKTYFVGEAGALDR